MDQAGFISFDEMEAWHDQLFEAYESEPPPGYAWVSAEQMLNADKKLFAEVSRACSSGVKISSSGDRPVEEALKSM